MDHSKAKAWVEENIEIMKKEMGLPHWSLDIVYEHICTPDNTGESTAVGLCVSHVEYERATITVDPEIIHDFDRLETILRHELAHIVHSPYAMLWDAIEPYLDSAALLESLTSIRKKCEELTVKNIERLCTQHRLRRYDAVNEFANLILHGDSEHKAWLIDSAKSYNRGEPIEHAKTKKSKNTTAKKKNKTKPAISKENEVRGNERRNKKTDEIIEDHNYAESRPHKSAFYAPQVQEQKT